MEEETILSEALAASLGGAISATILYPLEVVKTKMQGMNASDDSGSTVDESDPAQTASKNQPPLSMIHLTRDLYRQFGISVFVRGIEVSAMQSSLEKGLYFVSYTLLKKLHRYLTSSTTSSANNYVFLLYGYVSGWVHLPLTMPFDAWKTQIQSSRSLNGESSISMLLQLIRDPTFHFYKGISSYYILCMTPAIQYWIYEQLKILLLRNKPKRKRSRQLSIGESFVLGMISRTVSTVLVYPYIRRKVLLQTRKNVLNDDLRKNLMDQMQTISSSQLSMTDTNDFSIQSKWIQVLKKTKQLYYGIIPELTRGIMSASFMLMMKEHIATLVRNRSNCK